VHPQPEAGNPGKEAKMADPKNAPKPIEQTSVSPALRRIVGVIAAAAVAYGALWFYAQRAHAEEPVAPPAEVTEVAASDEDAEAESGSRLSQAFDFLVRGDSSQIVAAASEELDRRTKAVEQREAAAVEREVELAKAEAMAESARDKADAELAEARRQHEALTQCVLQAVKAEGKAPEVKDAE
jgi:hypothetical protein